MCIGGEFINEPPSAGGRREKTQNEAKLHGEEIKLEGIEVLGIMLSQGGTGYLICKGSRRVGQGCCGRWAAEQTETSRLAIGS